MCRHAALSRFNEFFSSGVATWLKSDIDDVLATGISYGLLSVSLSVRLSVTHRCCTEMAKRI